MRIRHQRVVALIDTAWCFVARVQVSTEALQMLSCSDEVDGVSYLRADFSIDCASPARRAHGIAAIVVVSLFSLGLPLASGLLLWHERRRHSSSSVAGAHTRSDTLLFLTNGLKPAKYWWECVQMLRKFFIVASTLCVASSTASLPLASTYMAPLIGDGVVDSRGRGK